MRTSTTMARTLAVTLTLVAGAGLAPPVPGLAAQDGPWLVVVNKSGSTVSLVDPATRREAATLPTGFTPHEVATSADGRWAYVTDYGTGDRPGSTITVLDLEQRRNTGTIDLLPHTRPHGIAMADDGTLWVTTEGSRHVLHVDPAARTVLQAVETAQQTTHQVAVSARHGRVYTANIGSGGVTAVDARSGEVLAQIPTGAGAEGIDVAPDGNTVYVTNRVAGTLSEIDVASNAVTRTLEVGAYPIRVRVLADGHTLLVSNAQANEVAVVDREAWRVARRIPVGAMPVGILLHPGGRVAYVANTADDRITVIDLANWRVVGEIVAGDEPDGMAWAR